MRFNNDVRHQAVKKLSMITCDSLYKLKKLGDNTSGPSLISLSRISIVTRTLSEAYIIRIRCVCVCVQDKKVTLFTNVISGTTTEKQTWIQGFTNNAR